GPEIGSLVGVVAVSALFIGAAGARFAELDGFALWTDEASNVGIMAVPVALRRVAGEFDLSAGVMAGSSGLLFAYLVTRPDLNVWLAIALVLLFGLVIGFINCMLVMKARFPS